MMQQSESTLKPRSSGFPETFPLDTHKNHITMLGTGNAHATRCYNTCFTLCSSGGSVLMSEAFCLYEDRELFKPYEKHHSTVLDAARLAERLQVGHLILYHTEDRTLENRKERYTAEAKTAFSGAVWVPDDLERITL